MSKDFQLIEKVLASSSAKDWANAKTEWTITGFDIDEDCESICVCGKEGLKDLYTITNETNDNVLYPIGSVCIKKFGDEALNQQMNYWQQLLSLKNLAVKYGKDGPTIDFFTDKKYFSRKLIHYLFALNFIDYKDFVFLLDMFNSRRDPISSQREYAGGIINLKIYPGLRKLLFDLRDKNVRRYLDVARDMNDDQMY